MQEYLTVEFTSHGICIQRARRLTEEEGAKLRPEYRDRTFVGVGNVIELPCLAYYDMPKRASDGEYMGEWNLAWIVTQVESDAYIQLNAERQAEKDRKIIAERRAAYINIIVQAERQGGAMTEDEAKKAMIQYNNTYNEGGYGFVPHYVTQKEFDAAKAWLESNT